LYIPFYFELTNKIDAKTRKKWHVMNSLLPLKKNVCFLNWKRNRQI